MRIAINTNPTNDRHDQASLLIYLAYTCFGQRLPTIDSTTWQAPQAIISAFGQENTSLWIKDCPNSGHTQWYSLCYTFTLKEVHIIFPLCFMAGVHGSRTHLRPEFERKAIVKTV